MSMQENVNLNMKVTDTTSIKMVDEEVFGGHHFIGEVFDTITFPDGSVEKREKSFNVVVNTISTLIAALLKYEPGYTAGTLYWALGSGATSWDTTSFTPANTDTKLTNEVFRKSIPTASRYFVDVNGVKLGAGVTSNRIQIDITIDATEANGYSLREFGIFGGNASVTKDSGLMVNHKAHSRIDKVDGMTIARSIRFTF